MCSFIVISFLKRSSFFLAINKQIIDVIVALLLHNWDIKIRGKGSIPVVSLCLVLSQQIWEKFAAFLIYIFHKTSQ